MESLPETATLTNTYKSLRGLDDLVPPTHILGRDMDLSALQHSGEGHLYLEQASLADQFTVLLASLPNPFAFLVPDWASSSITSFNSASYLLGLVCGVIGLMFIRFLWRVHQKGRQMIGFALGALLGFGVLSAAHTLSQNLSTTQSVDVPATLELSANAHANAKQLKQLHDTLSLITRK